MPASDCGPGLIRLLIQVVSGGAMFPRATTTLRQLGRVSLCAFYSYGKMLSSQSFVISPARDAWRTGGQEFFQIVRGICWIRVIPADFTWPAYSRSLRLMHR